MKNIFAGILVFIGSFLMGLLIYMACAFIDPSICNAELIYGGVRVDYNAKAEYVIITSTGKAVAYTFIPPTKEQIIEYNEQIIITKAVIDIESSRPKQEEGRFYAVVTPDCVIERIKQAVIKDINSGLIIVPTEIQIK